MAIRRSLLHACALLAALAPAQEAGGLRVSIDAPWAERAQVASSAGRLWEVERSLGDAPERRIDLDLPAGFEYAFALVGKGGLRRSQTFLSGPVVGEGAVEIRVEPRAFRRVPLRLRGASVERVESFDATSMAALARFPWPLSRTELSGMAGEVVLNESGRTLLRIQTSAGPHFLLVDPRPAEWGLELALPPLHAIEVVDGAGGPVSGAFVSSSFVHAPDLQEEERAELALLEMNTGLWIGGIADEAGRVALPTALQRIRRISACAPGFASREAGPGVRKVVLAARDVRRLTLSPRGELTGLLHVWPSCPHWMPGTRYREGVLEVPPEVETLRVLGGEGWFFSGPVGERSELPLERPEVEFRVEPAGLPGMFSVRSIGSSVFGVSDGVPLLVETFGEVGAGKGTRQHILARLGVVMRSAESCALEYGALQRPGEAPGLLVFSKLSGAACTIAVVDGDGKALPEARIHYRVQGLEESAGGPAKQGRPSPLFNGSLRVDPTGSCRLMAPLEGSIRFMVFVEGRAPLLGAVGAGRTARVEPLRPCWVKLEHPPDLVDLAYRRGEAWAGVDAPTPPGACGGLPVRRFRERAGEPMVIGPLHPGRVRLSASKVLSRGPRLLGEAVLELKDGELRVLEGWKEAE